MNYKTPSEIASAAVNAAAAKTRLSFPQMIVMGFLAGAYIAMGGCFMTVVTQDAAAAVGTGIAKLLGGLVFSLGLMLVVSAGGELFTGNCLITISVLIGVCVSISGTVSFVGLVMPHIARMLVGPNHKRLLPASLFAGAIFLLLADLVARTLLSPIELSIGVVTSLVGAVAFVIIFYRTRKAR